MHMLDSTNLKDFLKRFLSALRVSARIGGLEISDTSIRFAYFDGQQWQMAALRLPAGLIENNRVKNHQQFVEVLKSLRQQLPPQLSRQKIINVIATLTSVHIYTQVFTLPLIQDDNLEEAIQLNIKMISPLELSQAYAGWQLVSRNEEALRLEVLTAFINRQVVDELDQALREAGFFPIAVESGALSLSRLVREQTSGFDARKPYLVLHLDNRGIDFLIIRQGQLYFEYFNSWTELQNEKRQVPLSVFGTHIIRSLHQVLNFYNAHWPEPLSEVFLSSSSLTEEITKIIKENFSLNVRELKVKIGQSVRPEWFMVLGCSLRGEIPRAQDNDINLSGISVQEEFRWQQSVNFIKFWQVSIPLVLGLLIIVFSAVSLFLTNLQNSLESHASLNISSQQLKELADLESKINQFNRAVKLLVSFQQTSKPKTPLFDKINELMSANNLILDRLYLQGAGQPIILTGQAQSQSQILNLKSAMDKDPQFTSVNLPLSDIRPVASGFSFSINFLVSP